MDLIESAVANALARLERHTEPDPRRIAGAKV